MSSGSVAANRPSPGVLARLDPAGSDAVRASVDAAIAAGATMVEVRIADLEAIGAPSPVPCAVRVDTVDAAARAIALGATALRVEAVGPERERVAERAAASGVELHMPFGRGVPEAAVLDIGSIDGDAGDDLVGRLAALADLAAAGRRVIATIGPVGHDDTAALAALAVARGAAILRVHEVAAAARAARVVDALAVEHGTRSR